MKPSAPSQSTAKPVSSTNISAKITTAHNHGILPSLEDSQPSRITFQDVDFIISDIADSRSSLKPISRSISSTPAQAQTETAQCTRVQSAVQEAQAPLISFQHAISTDSEIVDFSASSHRIPVSNLKEVSAPQQIRTAIHTNPNDPICFPYTARAFPVPVRSPHLHDISLSNQPHTSQINSAHQIQFTGSSGTSSTVPSRTHSVASCDQAEVLADGQTKITTTTHSSQYAPLLRQIPIPNSSQYAPLLRQILLPNSSQYAQLSQLLRQLLLPYPYQFAGFSPLLYIKKLPPEILIPLSWVHAWGERKHNSTFRFMHSPSKSSL
jgi:hypothetical protein